MAFSRLRASTIPGLLVERARARPARVAFRAKELGVYRETTWAALAARVAAVAHGLAARFGVGRGSTVAILGDPCPEWTIADLAAQALGAVTYGIYPTSAPGEVRYLLEHGGARVVIVEDQEHLDKTLAVLDDAPRVPHDGAQPGHHDAAAGRHRPALSGEPRDRRGEPVRGGSDVRVHRAAISAEIRGAPPGRHRRLDHPQARGVSRGAAARSPGGIEGRHGFAGARRARGGMGGHFGAPHAGRPGGIEGRHGFAGAPRARGGMGGHFGAPHEGGRPRARVP